MDSFELNKILGAVLGTCLVLLALHIASGAIFTSPVPAKPGYVIDVKVEQPGAVRRRRGAEGSADRSSCLPAPRRARRTDREGLPDLPQYGERPG